MELEKKFRQKLQAKTLGELHSYLQRVQNANGSIERKKNNWGGEDWTKSLRLDDIRGEEYIHRVAGICSRIDKFDKVALPALEILETTILTLAQPIFARAQKNIEIVRRSSQPEKKERSEGFFSEIEKDWGFLIKNNDLAQKEFFQGKDSEQDHKPGNPYPDGRSERSIRGALSREERKVQSKDLTEDHLKWIIAVFAVNEDGTDFLYPTLSDVIKFIYRDRFEKAATKKEEKKINQDGYNALTSARNAFSSKIPKSLAQGETSPNITHLLDFIQNNPLYKSLSVLELRQVLDRDKGMGFEELQKRAASSDESEKEAAEETVFQKDPEGVQEDLRLTPQGIYLLARTIDGKFREELLPDDQRILDNIIRRTENVDISGTNNEFVEDLIRRVNALDTEGKRFNFMKANFSPENTGDDTSDTELLAAMAIKFYERLHIPT